jgi:hypothetical protein
MLACLRWYATLLGTLDLISQIMYGGDGFPVNWKGELWLGLIGGLLELQATTSGI